MSCGAIAGAAAASLVLAAACHGPSGPITCTTEAVAGIVVDLRGEDGGALSAADATGRAVDGDDAVELQPFLDQLIGAWERSGLYTVTVDKPGFETWSRADVRVADGECHVVPVRLAAILSPES